MTRKDYEALASIIRANRDNARTLQHGPNGVLVHVVDQIGDEIGQMLAADNPRFDSERWLQACGR